MERDSRALFAVRTFAYVALLIPRTQTMLLIAAPIMNVIPLVFSINSEKTSATRRTTIEIVLYSVFMNVAEPLRIIAAISVISAVPSLIPRIRA